MELLVLAGLAMAVFLAAILNRGEPEVETVIITRPTSQRAANPLVPLLIGLGFILVMLVLLDRLQRWLVWP
ncbi:MAG: hypothetical protein SNJ69_09690 [Chloroflexaceae bacterium]